MPNVLDKRGRFWWFNETAGGGTSSIATSIPGVITISDDGKIELNLEGSLWSEATTESRWDEPRWLPEGKRILGRLGEYGGDGYVLLDDLRRTDFWIAGEEPSPQSYEALHCFSCSTPFPENFDPDGLRELRIELLGLNEWLGLDSIRTEEQYPEGESGEVRVTYKNHKIPYKTPLADINVESLVIGASSFLFLHDHPTGEVNIRQINWLVYSPTVRHTLPDFQVAYKRIEELLSLLLGTYFRLDWPILVGSNGEFDGWYKLYFHRGGGRNEVPPRYLQWASFASVRGIFGDLLYRWQTAIERYSAGYELYLASLQNPLPQPEHRFVTLIWTIESLHRKWAKEAGEIERETELKECIEEIVGRFSAPSEKKVAEWLRQKLEYAYEPTLKNRIIHAFKRLPISLKTAQLKGFAMRCAKRRNDISHIGGCGAGEDRASFESELEDLTDALSILFHALVLHEIGLPDDHLVRSMTEGGIAELRAIPALRRVGIELPSRVSPEDPCHD